MTSDLSSILIVVIVSLTVLAYVVGRLQQRVEDGAEIATRNYEIELLHAELANASKQSAQAFGLTEGAAQQGPAVHATSAHTEARPTGECGYCPAPSELPCPASGLV